MDHDLVLADSAGHTMIDIDANRAPDRDGTPKAESGRDEEPRED